MVNSDIATLKVAKCVIYYLNTVGLLTSCSSFSTRAFALAVVVNMFCSSFDHQKGCGGDIVLDN